MPKCLIIAEKPSVAGEIADALGGFSRVDGFRESATAIVSSGIGHLVSLDVPEAETGGKNLASLPVIPARFGLKVIDKTKSQFALLRKLMSRSDVDCIVNACDAGREGELIFRLIYEAAACKKPVKRMWLQSMTKEAICDAWKNLKPGREFNALGDAARCRAESDWLVGINGSRGVADLHSQQTGHYQQMTAGRVQTPTLAILAHLEQRIRSFVPEDYWEVHATFRCQAGSYDGKWIGTDQDASIWKGDSADDAMQIVNLCKQAVPGHVNDVYSESKESPPKLFDLTTLQREANKRYKFSAKKTLDIAQSLYEKYKATTYPRTDADALPEDYASTVQNVMQSLPDPYRQFAAKVCGEGWIKPSEKRIFDNSKIKDHFAIIPTGTVPHGLDSDEAKIFDMVVRRFVGAFYPPAVFRQTRRTTPLAGGFFLSTGRVLISAGWREVLGQDGDRKDKDAGLTQVIAGEQVSVEKLFAPALQTKPPSRFTEAGLLAAMESAGKLVDDEALANAMKGSGLGTPATRAGIIEGLLSTQDAQRRPKDPYVTREGKEQHLVPTSKGMGLIEFLDANGVDALTSPRMTGEWEQRLAGIERGEIDPVQFMRGIGEMVSNFISLLRQQAGRLPAREVKRLAVPCPKCAAALRVTERTVDCEAGCGVRIWREVAGRTLSDTEIQTLLEDGSIKQLDGFKNKSGRKFSAGLKFEDLKVALVFEDRADASASVALSGASCPKCGGEVHAHTGDSPYFGCTKCDFKMWRVVAGRALSDDEARQLIMRGEMPAVHGFVGRKGKFGAGLRMSRDFRKLEFVFEGR